MRLFYRYRSVHLHVVRKSLPAVKSLLELRNKAELRMCEEANGGDSDCEKQEKQRDEEREEAEREIGDSKPSHERYLLLRPEFL